LEASSVAGQAGREVGGGGGVGEEDTSATVGTASAGCVSCRRAVVGRWQLGHESSFLKYISPQLGHCVTLPAISTPQLGQTGALSLI